MKTQDSFTLIDGDFSTQESREILQNVFSSKIQFHQLKNFSAQERYGKDDEKSSKRIPELRNSLEKILNSIDAAEKEDYSILKELFELLQKPYEEQPEYEKWFAKRPDWARVKIGCSMLSCSS